MIVAVHVLGFGLLLLKLGRLSVADLPTRCAIVGSAGFAALGFEMWGLGYLRAWYWQTLCWSTVLLAMVCIALIWPLRKSVAAVHPLRLRQLLAALPSLLVRVPELQLALTALAAATVMAAIISGLRPPLVCDELEYHWPAPLYWATNHHWVVSPYRLTNGPVLVELLYTISALFGNFVAGHWISTAIWLVLLCACVGLGRLMTIPVLPVLVAVMACPTMTTEASMMLNDLGAALFIVVAFLTLLQLGKNQQPYRTVLSAAFIFCGAISSKAPYAVAAAPAMLAYLFCGGAVPKLGQRIKLALTFIAPGLLVGGLWCLHTHGLTGNYSGLPVQTFATSRPLNADLQSLHNPTGMVSLPNLSTLLTLPILPFITAIFGNQEPFGGRTGLMMCTGLPLLLWRMKKLQAAERHYIWWLIAASTLYYGEIGLLTPRTRYFYFTWAIWSTLAAAGFWLTYQATAGAKRMAVAAAFCALATVGCADSIRTLLLYRPGTAEPVLMQLHWFQD